MLYFFILVLLVFCSYFFDIKNYNRGRGLFTFIVYLTLILMSTFRYRMGGDGLFYEDTYPEMPTLQNAINYIRF
ncbi:MAG: hypothetical protein RIS29_1307, partial [Bacteroidota bacterium]